MRNLFALIGVVATVLVIAIGVYLFGGFYNVAVGDRSRDLFDQALERIREASVSRRADSQPPILLDDQEIIQSGARKFSQLNCVECHSAPSVQRKAFGRAMNPGPPGPQNLSKGDPSSIFWIVKNGIRMTGMPSFGNLGVNDDDIWRIVAFVKKLPTVSDDQYKAWIMPAQNEPSGQTR